MSTRDLINAIAAGDAIEIENAFNSVMAEKISSRIDELRIDVAQNLFAEEVEEIEEEFDIISEEEYLALSEEEQSEFEQINELSTNLIARYRAKANDAYINHDDNISAHYKLAKKAAKAGDKETEKHHQGEADKEWKKYFKRKTGEHQARKKLISRGAKWDQKVYPGDRM